MVVQSRFVVNVIDLLALFGVHDYSGHGDYLSLSVFFSLIPSRVEFTAIRTILLGVPLPLVKPFEEIIIY